MRGPIRYALPCILVAAVLLSACNQVPIEGLEKSLQIEVEKSSGDEPVKIDFLWVVDNSTSMCEEQIQLAENFDQFTTKLSELFKLDPRLAVVSHDMTCTLDNHNVQNAQGRFSINPATTFPKSCQPKIIKQCSVDADCGGLDASRFNNNDTNGEWSCQNAQSEFCEVNPNGSYNTECHRHCSTDEECQQVFGDSRYTCQKQGGQKDWACLLPPKTTNCPETLGPILGANELPDFPCLATIGVNQNKCFKYEQGLSSAMAALDRSGPNEEYLSPATGVADFLREDAYLVILFVTDEDDCSAACGSAGDSASSCPHSLCGKEKDDDGKWRCTGALVEDVYDTCALLGGQNEGGPLIPVSHFTNQIKSLKSDPSKVIVAAIAGDAVVPEGAASVQTQFERVITGLALGQDSCQRKCTDGDWSDVHGHCIPDSASDCLIGEWSPPTDGETQGTCAPNADGQIDEVDAGTTSFPRCADDVVDNTTQTNSVSACIANYCATDHDADVQADTEARLRDILKLSPETPLLLDPENPTQADFDQVASVLFTSTCATNCGETGTCNFESCVECDTQPGNPDEACVGPSIEELSTLNEAYREVIREAYNHSKGSPYTCFETTYVCESGSGRADWGSRYFELTERFGPSGIFTNICDNAGIGPALETIAEKIINVVNRMCLPIHIYEYGKICEFNSDCQSGECVEGTCATALEVVKITRDPATGEDVHTPLIESDSGEDGTYQVIPGGCLENDVNGGEVFRDAIVFGSPPEPGQYIEITYKGTPVDL